MTTKLHNGDLFFDFVLLTTEVIGDGQMWARTWNPLSLELVETIRTGVMAWYDFDSLKAFWVFTKEKVE
jgi:hypothetical protein